MKILDSYRKNTTPHKIPLSVSLSLSLSLACTLACSLSLSSLHPLFPSLPLFLSPPLSRAHTRALSLMSLFLQMIAKGFMKEVMTSSYIRHDSSTCVSCLIHMCDMNHFHLQVSMEGSIGSTKGTSGGGVSPRDALFELRNESACFCPTCGDGRVQWEADEKCDDGNTNGADGCDAACKVEPLYLCSGPKTPALIGLPKLSYKTKDTCIRLGSAWVPYGEASWAGGARFGAGAVVHKNAIWLVGGLSSNFKHAFSTVFSEATNGASCLPLQPSDTCAKGPTGTSLSWVVASPDSYTPWLARAFMGVVTYKDRLYVIGGARSECTTNSAGKESCALSRTQGDVWQSAAVASVKQGDSSMSGLIAWTQVTNSAAWSTRARAAHVVFDGLIWMIGGQSISGLASARVIKVYNDVWHSNNGKDWVSTTVQAPWSARCGHTVAVFPHLSRQAMFIMGGSDMSSFFNDVWRSYDGLVWTIITSNAAFPPRWQHSTVAFRDNLWVLGGHVCRCVAEDSCVRVY